MKVPGYLEEIYDHLERWRPLGERRYGDGTLLLGWMPNLGVGAYLHRLFGPAAHEDVVRVEGVMQQEFPDCLKEFYQYHNGSDFFRELPIYGFRRSYDRADFDAMACNPFDILVPALVNRPMSPSGRGVKFSRYVDKSMCFAEPDGSIVRVSHASPHVVSNRWSSLDAWLVGEVKRLSKLYDDSGKCTVNIMDTLPPPDVLS